MLNLKMIKAGSINEPGFINNWNKQGFTFNKAGSELISNSIDAFSEDISFLIKEEDSQKCIDMIDNGIGMTIEKFPKSCHDGKYCTKTHCIGMLLYRPFAQPGSGTSQAIFV